MPLVTVGGAGKTAGGATTLRGSEGAGFVAVAAGVAGVVSRASAHAPRTSAKPRPPDSLFCDQVAGSLSITV